MSNRRQFFKLAGAGILATNIGTLQAASFFEPAAAKNAEKFKLGMAGYTFKEFTVEETIKMMNRTGVSYLSLKDFHMPQNSSQEQINTVLKTFKDAGIEVYTLGVIYMKTNENVDLAFEYAKKAGVKMIVGAPNYELLPYVEKKVMEYDIRLAIHNHGPDNPLYPNAGDIWENIKNMDARIGICIDIGHTQRDGQNPAKDIEKYKSRIFDIHIKDVDKASADGKTIEMGRGIINIPEVVASIRKIGFTGCCSLEFEKDMKDPLPGIAESLGYFRGVLAQ